jgi:hypothetical protein
MMGPTHVAAGVALAAPLTWLAPEFAVAGALAGAAGGFLPDLDLLRGVHRRTLHYPVLYWLPAAAFAALAVASPAAWSVAGAVGFAAAAVHSGMDRFGAGDEPRPWERTSDRGVYLHVARRWLRPTYRVRYDGAPEDLLLALLFAVPGLVLFDPPVRAVTLVALAVGVAYAAVRKRVPEYVDL